MVAAYSYYGVSSIIQPIAIKRFTKLGLNEKFE